MARVRDESRSRGVTQSLNLYFVRNSGGERFVDIDWTEHHRTAFAFNGLPLQTRARRWKSEGL